MKAIVFDFDGTMINTENVWYTVTMAYIKETYGINLPEDLYKACIGTSDDPIHDYMKKKTNGKFNSHDFTAYISNRLHEERENLELRKGFMRIFDYVVKNDFKIGLATSSAKEWVLPVLEKFNLREHFKTIQTADNVKEIKPHPSLYLQAIKELGAPAEKTYAVEDSLNGAISALKAGLQVIVVPNEATEDIMFPHRVKKFNHFDEIDLKKVFHIMNED